MKRQGQGEEGREGWERLWEWEMRRTIDVGIVKLWPIDDPSRLSWFVKTSHSNAQDAAMLPLLSAYHRWALGIPLQAYGSLEDLRWLMFGSRCPGAWTCKGGREIACGVSCVGTQEDEAPRKQWELMQYPQWGSYTAQCPASTGSGCVWATCVLAVVDLRLQGIIKDNGPDAITASPSAWTRTLQKVFCHCGALSDLRNFCGNQEHQQVCFVAAVNDLTKNLITVVWRQLMQASSEHSLLLNKDLARVWKLLTTDDPSLPAWLAEAWQRLDAVAGPEAVQYVDPTSHHFTWMGTPMDEPPFHARSRLSPQ